MPTKAFQAELAYLREAGQAFSQAHPALAYHLGRPGSDPDIERLLEGFAFLTARIQTRAQRAAPELVEELASLWMPQLVGPTPACTIIQAGVDPHSLRTEVSLPAQTAVEARLDDPSAVCRFVTSAPCALLPLEVVSTTLVPRRSDVYDLRICCHAVQALQVAPGRLRFYIAAPYAEAATLLQALCEHVVAVQVRQGDETVVLPPDSCVAPLDDPELALFGERREPSTGYRLLDEYLLFPEKFLFFDVHNLALAHKLLVGEFTLEICIAQGPPTGPLPRDCLRLHCVPARNEFCTTAVPLSRGGTGHRQLLRADDVDPAHAQVLEVLQVVGVRPGMGARHVYPSFGSFLHDRAPDRTAYYQLSREPSCVDGAADTYLSLHGAEDELPSHEREVVSVQMTCTNRLLPARLGQGDVRHLGQTALARSAQNVTRVSVPLQPCMGDALVWRTLALLTHGHMQPHDAASLRQHLALYTARHQASHAHAAAHGHRLAAIAALSRRTMPQMVRGVSMLTQRTTLALEESGFASSGDAYLFGRVLRALFEGESAVQAVEGVSLQLRPSGRHYSWPICW